MDRLNIALLKFNGKPYLKTELHCTGKFTPRNFPPFIFSIASEPGIQDGTKEITKVYRYFKDDLRLTEPQARNQDLAIEAMSDEDDAGDAGWSMLKSDVNPRPKDTEQIPADGSEVVYFSPMHASGFFIANLCAEAIQRVRDLFGEEEEIHIRFTAPNYEFEGDKSGAGQVLSQNYRDNIRSLIDEFIGHEKYPNVQFRLKGSDFVYEPYAAYHYFSKVEHAIDVRKEERGTTYLVFDMGGSTTDVAIVQVAGEEKQVFTAYPVSQSVRRAGEYYDRCILKHLLGRQQVTKRGEPKWTDVLDQIEQAKIRLCEGETDVEKVSIEIDGTIEKKVIDREVLRNVLTDVWERGASNQRIGRRLRGFLNRARKQVREHNFQVEFDQIDRVFLAGGSSSLPGIEQLIQQELASVGLWSGDTETNVEDASDVASAGEEDSSAWFHRFVNPKWKFFNGQDISKSVVVAAGRAAALSSKLGGDEPNDGRHDVEGQSVYVRVVDDEGEEYIFERKDERIAEKDGEFSPMRFQ